MDWVVSITVLFGTVLALMTLGVPVAYSFMCVNIVALYYFAGVGGLEVLVRSIYDSLAVFVLLPITLFIFMGELIFQSGIARRMIDTLDLWIGRLPGRLSLLAVVSGAIMAAMSGASIASTAMLGSSMLPEMKTRGYRNEMSLGPVAAGGGLSVTIPPSGLAIILAVIAQVSVGRLLIAIVIPGLLMASLYLTYIVGRCWLNPRIAPAYDAPKVQILVRLRMLAKYVLPLGLIFFLVLGTIFVGVATPTESAALGCVGALLLALMYRSVNAETLVRVTKRTAVVSAMILLILAGAQAFSQVLAVSGVTRGLSAWVLSLEVSPILVVAAMLGGIIVLGMFVGGAALMMLTVPVFLPAVLEFGYDGLWFCVLVLLCVEIGQTTPPYGTQLFVLKAAAPAGTTYGDVIRSTLPFTAIDIGNVGIVLLIPAIALWLPGMGGA